MFAHRGLATVTIFALLILGAGCGGDNSGAGGWDLGADAGGDASSDTRDDDAEPDTSPTCGDLDSETSCNPVEGCTWRQRVCDGEVLEEGCFASDTVPVPQCPSIDPATCPEREDCPSSVCEVLHPGCGTTPEDGVELTEDLCAPSVSCESDADCPGDLSCADVNINPCYESECGACGSQVKKCVPPEMLPGESVCDGLAPEACLSNDTCAAIYPAECDREVPEGVVAYDEFKCLPRINQQSDALCEPGLSDCPDGYACGRVWAGCPPDADCFVCASEAEVCLPQ